jgi:hypothetical protein
MYPECRHIRTSGATCSSPALKGSHWCYFHARLNQRQTIHHALRNPKGQFASKQQTIDCGTIPVGPAREGDRGEESTGAVSASLDLPPAEDAASIQLALIDVLQALAANRLDPKRAGLLLYGLQVASANVKNAQSDTNVRTVTHTEDGTPLAPQSYGFDLEDFEEIEQEEEKQK